MSNAVERFVEDWSVLESEQEEWNWQYSELDLGDYSGNHLSSVVANSVWDSLAQLGRTESLGSGLTNGQTSEETRESVEEPMEEKGACKRLDKWHQLALASGKCAIHKAQIEMILQKVLHASVPSGNGLPSRCCPVEFDDVNAAERVEYFVLVLLRSHIADSWGNKTGFLPSKPAEVEPNTTVGGKEQEYYLEEQVVVQIFFCDEEHGSCNVTQSVE